MRPLTREDVHARTNRQSANCQRHDQSSALMDDMIAHCGVDLLALIGKDGGQSHVVARSRCRGCATVKACRDWLLTA
ncbi:MAG: DUF6455 family protein, partial [Methyloceanibacter sp.]